MKLFFSTSIQHSFILFFHCSWHDAGTYDVNTKTGGPNGSIRHEEEYKHGANAGLKIAIDLCGELVSIFINSWIVLNYTF